MTEGAPYVIAIYSKSTLRPYNGWLIAIYSKVMPKVQRSSTLSLDSVFKWRQSLKVTLGQNTPFLYYCRDVSYKLVIECTVERLALALMEGIQEISNTRILGWALSTVRENTHTHYTVYNGLPRLSVSLLKFKLSCSARAKLLFL